VSLWAELRERVTGAGGLEWRDATRTPDLPCADVGGGRRLLFMSWSTLLGRMASSAAGALETATELDIRQLRGLADRMDADAFLPVRAEELGPGFARRMAGLQRLFEDARQRLEDSGIADDFRPFASAAAGHGRYMTIGGSHAWLGIWYPAWPSLRDTPLWLPLIAGADRGRPIEETRRRLAPLVMHEPSDAIEGAAIDRPGSLLVPIMLPTGVAYEAVLDAVVGRLTEVAALLADESSTTS